MMNTEKRLQVDNLSCVRQHRLLFKSISFELYSSQVLFVEGPNGTGKSSLLRLLTGLATPSQGSISWQGKSIQILRADYWHNLHYISHTNGIKLGLTVIENLKLANSLSLVVKHCDYNSVLEHWELSTHKDILAKFLSAGQKRRLALAKLFLIPKPLWILDEPLTSLDITSQTLFLSHLQKHLQTRGLAVISSHHSIPTLTDMAVKTLRLEPC